MASPIRTCVICRKKDQKKFLNRYVWSGDKPAHDVLHRMGGRGAYCCTNKKCVEKLQSLEQKWLKIFKK